MEVMIQQKMAGKGNVPVNGVPVNGFPACVILYLPQVIEKNHSENSCMNQLVSDF
jgi:hypothetical protein